MPPLARHTVIVGGGLAGLACARELGADFTLLEADDRLGGLCRTEVEDGFSFDWTGHFLHARDPEMKELIRERWLRGNLLEVERRARIYSQGAWTSFPYQHNLRGLPAQTIADCLIGFVEATLGEGGRALRGRAPRDAAEFIERHLGRGFARHFMLPYNEKLFGVPCAELSPEWGGRFVPRPSLDEVVRGALGLPNPGAGYNASFWYPREGGIEALVRGLFAEVRALPGRVATSAPVASIDLAARSLRTRAGEELRFDALVVTAPLPQVVRLLRTTPPDVAAAAARLRAVAVTVVELGAEDAGGERFHWAYFPEPRFGFYRVGSPSEVNPRLAPPGCRSFAVEFAHRGPADPARFVDEAVAALHELGLLDRARVKLRRARTLPTAYVLFDREHAAARAAVLAHLEAHGVHAAGRYGRWEYSSMEDALLSGREAARAARAAGAAAG